MNEIWVPQALAALFLLLPLLRAFVERLRTLEGIAWLPFLALGILAIMFPAYGFRIEAVPILAFALVYSVLSLVALIAGKTARDGEPRSAAREASRPRAIVGIVFLAICATPMFAFAPRALPESAAFGPGARSIAVSGGEYVLRVFGDAESGRPIIFIVPPDLGSAASIELVSQSLSEKGFTVVTYSSRSGDAIFINEKGRTRARPTRLWRNWFLETRLTESAAVNARRVELEAARKSEIEYLLPRLPALLGVADGNLPAILFVGYDSGGSALAWMAGDNGFLARNAPTLGAVAIGSKLWSSYRIAPRAIEPLTDSGRLTRLRTNIGNWFAGLSAQRVSRTGSLPEAGLPILYLVSGRAFDEGRRQTAYQAVFDALEASAGPAAIVGIEGAGPFDYQDFPFTQPVLSFLFPGLSGAQRSVRPIDDTAAIIGNFASRLLEIRAEWGAPVLPALPQGAIPAHSAITVPLRVESQGMPWLRL
ncbi:MAG: hypothetical protein FWE09_07530 [Treponema sp.]|nr:hypothetical protein [Treponema sp.]